MARPAIQATECRGRQVIREMGEPPATPELTPVVRVAAQAALPVAARAPREAQVATQDRAEAARARAAAPMVGRAVETPGVQGRAPARVPGAAVSLSPCGVGKRRPVSVLLARFLPSRQPAP